MARTDSLSIVVDKSGGGTQADQLSEIYGQVIDSIQKRALSVQYKNETYSGDPTSGSVEIDRFKNSTVNTYGTARTAAAGDKLNNSGKVTVNLDTDKEIVEEVEQKDIALFGLPSILAKRAANHVLRMAASLDTAFFAQMVTDGSAVTLTAGTKYLDQFEAVVQAIETTSNDYVDGVDRDLIVVSMKPSAYGKFKNYINTINDGDSRNGSFGELNGVEVVSNTRQTKDVIAFVRGSVAQPVYTSGDYAEQDIPLSSAKASAIFFHYGTKTVTPDLVKYATLVAETA